MRTYQHDLPGSLAARNLSDHIARCGRRQVLRCEHQVEGDRLAAVEQASQLVGVGRRQRRCRHSRYGCFIGGLHQPGMGKTVMACAHRANQSGAGPRPGGGDAGAKALGHGHAVAGTVLGAGHHLIDKDNLSLQRTRGHGLQLRERGKGNHLPAYTPGSRYRGCRPVP